jgi:hypothetical protein
VHPTEGKYPLVTTINLQADILHALADDTDTSSERRSALWSYGVENVILATDNFGGKDGVSVYLEVSPDQFANIATDPGYRYPTWLVGVYAELVCALDSTLRQHDVRLIQNEALAVGRLLLAESGFTPGNPDNELLLLGLRMALVEQASLDDGYYPVQHSAVMDLMRGKSEAEAMEIAADLAADPAKLEALANDGDGWLQAINELDLWLDAESMDGQFWVQFTVIPSGAPTDADLEKATHVTRFGYNLYVPADQPASAEVTEIRRHLANRTAEIRVAHAVTGM